MTKLDRFHAGLEIKFVATDESTKVGTFSGYGAVFGNLDSYGDTIKKGAFKTTLKDWKAKGKYPPMLLQHGGGFFGGTSDDLVPIGKWNSMKEDDRGLAVEGELFALGTQRGQYLYEGLKSGVLDGLSIGYIPRTVKYGEEKDEPNRTLLEVDLMELSVVTFPANSEARIGAVKSADLTERDFERWLMRDAGLSKKDAMTIIAKGFRALKATRDAEPSMFDDVMNALKGKRDAAPEGEALRSELLGIFGKK